MGLFWKIGNYGREAAAFLNWATGNCKKWVSLPLLFVQKIFFILILFTPQHKISQFYTESFTTIVKRSPLGFTLNDIIVSRQYN
jgi:hypothetical protein